MSESSLDTSFPKTAFNPLVELGVRIAKTLSHLRAQGGRSRPAG